MRKIFSGIAVLLILFASISGANPVRASGRTVSSEDEAARIVREAMVDRESSVELTYPVAREKMSEDELMSLTVSIYEKAVEHTGAGGQGDYLSFHIGQYIYGFSYEDRGDSTVNVTLQFQFSYYTTASQEDAVTAKVREVLDGLELSGKSDYEKVKAIFDYICQTVKYDNANLDNDAYKLKYSAYAALINKTSVCQGYANLFYRMANEAGLDTRIVSGVSRGENHAWNIVKVDGKYYNIDTTWDAVTKDYSYFLKGSANFDEHAPTGEHPANYSSYPISATDYVPESSSAPTEAPTEASTEALTEESTEGPTEESTEVSTETPTEESTEVPTEASTEVPTEVSTEAPTEESTEPLTEAPTEESTEALTETSTEAPTEVFTEVSTETSAEVSTEAPTEVSTEASTEESTETPTKPSAQETTEVLTQTPTKESTEAVTGEEKFTETTAQAEEPTGETPKGSLIYFVVGIAGVAVVGTVVVTGRVILKKRNAK